MGAEAVMALMEADESEPPCVVSLDGNQVRTVSHLKFISIIHLKKLSIHCILLGHSCSIDGVR